MRTYNEHLEDAENPHVIGGQLIGIQFSLIRDVDWQFLCNTLPPTCQSTAAGNRRQHNVKYYLHCPFSN